MEWNSCYNTGTYNQFRSTTKIGYKFELYLFRVILISNFCNLIVHCIPHRRSCSPAPRSQSSVTWRSFWAPSRIPTPSSPTCWPGSANGRREGVHECGGRAFPGIMGRPVMGATQYFVPITTCYCYSFLDVLFALLM